MVRAKSMGYRVTEVPISFVDRGETILQDEINAEAADNPKFMESLS